MTNTTAKTGPRRGIAGRFTVIVAVSALCSYVAVAAVVSLQPPTPNGTLLRIPVILTGHGEESLAGIQFDLAYDATQYTLEAVEAGDAASEAGKNVVLSTPTPGQGRILVTGFNADNLFDGHVATLLLRPKVPDASEYGFSVRGLLATDPFGNRVPLDYEDAYNYPLESPDAAEASVVESETAATKSDAISTDSDDEPGPVAVDTVPAENFIGDAGGTLGRHDIDRPDGTPARPVPSTTETISGDEPVGDSSRHPQSQTNQSYVREIPPRPAVQRDSTTRPGDSMNTSSEQTPSGKVQDSHTPSPNAESPQRLALVLPLPSERVTVTEGAQPIMRGGESVQQRDFAPRTVAHVVLFICLFCLFTVFHLRAYRWLTDSPWKRRP